ncbi:MAG: RagB/SusD family nutrient uptake outer membrane protein [Bacteroidaceae bacterium]|nr:RagB/SusD family nutrient uptake outer membrane protein [Bacteroidaceae bacterium]
MKIKIFLAVLFSVTVIIFPSCDNFLDITPEGQVKRSEMLNTTDGIEDALYGVYAQLRQGELYGMALGIYGIEILGQNMDCYGSDFVTNLGSYNWEYSQVREWSEGVWTAMYNNISNVNSVLSADLVADAKNFPYNIYKGEALALRAFMHFDLLRLFAPQYTLDTSVQGIPYQTTFSLHTPDFESMTANFEHILSDLLEAEELLSEEGKYVNQTSFMTDRQTHFNLHAVRAELARVYFTMGNNEKAAEYAKKVIEESPYQLKEKTEVLNDVAGVFSRKECVFGVYYADFYGNVSGLLQQQQSYYSLTPRDDFMDSYNAEADGLDYRWSAYFTAVETGGEIHYRLSKFTDIYELNNIEGSRPTDLILGINIIRIPEMYYIMAECLLDSDIATATSYYNAVRQHRGLEPLASDRKLTIELIVLERLKEYFGEGLTFFNNKRLNLSMTSADGKTQFPPSNDIYVVPIPDSEYANRY